MYCYHFDLFRPQLDGADEIISYLFETYGTMSLFFFFKQGKFELAFDFHRLGLGEDAIPKSIKSKRSTSKGVKVRADARPDFAKLKPLTLYGKTQVFLSRYGRHLIYCTLTMRLGRCALRKTCTGDARLSCSFTYIY
jgi:hypothetical protein